MDIEKMKIENGAVELNGEILVLLQQAYHNGNPTNPRYEAIAVNKEGEEYRVEWIITNQEAEEECDVCNWDSYDIYSVAGQYVGGTDK